MKSLTLIIIAFGINAFATTEPVANCPASGDTLAITNVTVSKTERADVFSLAVTRPNQTRPETYLVQKPALYATSGFTVYSGSGVRLTILNYDAKDEEGRYRGYFEDGSPEFKGVACDIK